MYVKLGPVSYNSKTGKINVDRRTIKGVSIAKHTAYIVAGVAATILVKKAVDVLFD
jgi:hypothetical protein